MQVSDLQGWVDSKQANIEEMLKTLVEINTYTANTEGVDHGMDVMSQMADDLGFTTEVINGRHRLVKAGNGTAKPRIMLISHMDTVFPPDSDFKGYTPLDGGFVRGPGTGDIKGGLVLGLWAMKALSELSNDFDVQMAVSADEEKGSPTIRDWYLDGHTGADFAIGLEPGFPQGPLTADVPLGVVYQRRGYCAINFTVYGKDAHSGVPQNGLSAIEAMAQRIVKIHALSDYEQGVTTNIGLVQGGISPNTVAGEATATVSFRYWTMEQGEKMKAQVEQIISEPCMYNAEIDMQDRAEFTLEGFLPPMEPSDRNQVLVDIILEEAKRLGHNVVPIARGGGSDANFVSGAGTPTICGMGAPAEGIHTTNEKIHLPMLFNRVNLLASTLYRLIERGVPA